MYHVLLNHIVSLLAGYQLYQKAACQLGVGGGGGRYAPPARAFLIRSSLQCREPNPPQWAACDHKANSALCLCSSGYTWLPGCYRWNIGSEGLRQCAPCCSFILGNDTPKKWKYFPGGRGRGGRHFKWKSDILFNISCIKLRKGRDFLPVE